MATPQPVADVDTDADYSPSSTITTFDHPLPLLRHPFPSSSQFVLAFKDARSFSTAYKSCLSALTSQCDAGARIGCAIAASNKCKPPGGNPCYPNQTSKREKGVSREKQGPVWRRFQWSRSNGGGRSLRDRKVSPAFDPQSPGVMPVGFFLQFWERDISAATSPAANAKAVLVYERERGGDFFR